MDSNTLTLAEHYLSIKQPEKVLETLSKSDIDLDSVVPWRLRAQALYELDRYSEALENTQKALAIEPENIQLLYLLSKTQAELKNLAAAERAILTALRLSPENPVLLSRYAVILGQGSQMAKAQKVLAEAVRINPDELTVKNAQTILAYIRGDSKAVQTYSQAILKDNPDNIFGHYMLGQSYLGKRQTGSADKHFRNAATLAPDIRAITDVAKETRFYNHPLMWPLYPIRRFGRIPVWLGLVALMVGLAALGWEAAAGMVVLLYFFLVVYSWTVPRLLRWYLKRRN
jgi:cytochrome c-type biogenesis protein CcmH/NrfG